ncbi:9597_t:CDS:2 [Cetraspora pellucida]|uniref:9597_t:CDS:1 n=1 Tax=Cetraspora pellucida TaxID=1433469 RepID=A0A9N9BET9_9GLOM|nr:9597_t:CDS:2 [Cetraspora pellucida]
MSRLTDETSVSTVFQVDLSNRSSWVWKFFHLEIYKEDDEWCERDVICKIETLIEVKCEQTYQTESSIGNLIGYLLVEH